MKSLKIDHYKNLLSRYYFFFRANAEAIFNDTHLKHDYDIACKEKKSIHDSKDWSSLISTLKSNPSIERVRDGSHDTPHCLKILLSLKNDIGYGIGVCLTLTGYFLGFYYMSEKLVENKRVFGFENGYYLSYDPIIDSQSSVEETIGNIIKDTFPQFKLFDTFLSDYPIESIQGQTYFYDQIDLFKILFSDNLTGII